MINFHSTVYLSEISDCNGKDMQISYFQFLFQKHYELKMLNIHRHQHNFQRASTIFNEIIVNLVNRRFITALSTFSRDFLQLVFCSYSILALSSRYAVPKKTKAPSAGT